jgi:hypothetical protein
MGTDLLILTVYFICVVYVLYQMALSVESSLEDQLVIVLDKESLQAAVTAQLEQQTAYQAQAEVLTEKGISLLKLTFLRGEETVGAIALQVLPQGRRPLQPPLSDLNVAILNTLPDQQVFINWDHSSLSAHGGIAQRVIRKIPGSPTDLLQPQVYTVVNPTQRVSVAVTSEGLLNRPDNQTALNYAPAFVDLSKVPNMPEPARHYSLRVLMWVQSMTNPNRPALQLLIPFMFRINVLPDHVARPVLSWLLNLFTPKPNRKAR